MEAAAPMPPAVAAHSAITDPVRRAHDNLTRPRKRPAVAGITWTGLLTFMPLVAPLLQCDLLLLLYCFCAE